MYTMNLIPVTYGSIFFVSVLDQGDARPVKVNTAEQTQSRHTQTTVEFITEDEEVIQGFYLSIPFKTV